MLRSKCRPRPARTGPPPSIPSTSPKAVSKPAPPCPPPTILSTAPKKCSLSKSVPRVENKKQRYDYSGTDYSFVHATDTIDHPAFYVDPSWSDASSEEDFDPTAGLPYCPRWKISSRRANSMIVLAATLSAEEIQAEFAIKRAILQRQEARRTMVRVAAQILEVGAERAAKREILLRRQALRTMALVVQQIVEVGSSKRTLEKTEVGPPPHGFAFVQVDDDLHLTRIGGDGSLVYVDKATRVFIRSN
ncbi:hypothetical protein C8R43DRAFT_960500 [Mycena crocata]|nr:hypothetical protein C8R43DRAFT_960500 [Mycena crocata]